MNAKSIILFISGLAMGGAAGFIATKTFLEKKYEKKYKEDIAEMESYYNKVDEYARSVKKETKEESDDQNEDRGRMSPEERAEIKEKLNKNWEGTTNYAGMYQNGDMAEESEESDEIEEEKSLDEEAFDWHQENRNNPPELISVDVYEDLPSYIDQKVLYYYDLDRTLCDDEDVEVEEPERLIGDLESDIFDCPDQVVFVMNYAIDTCYEIQKIDGAYFAS